STGDFQIPVRTSRPCHSTVRARPTLTDTTVPAASRTTPCSVRRARRRVAPGESTSKRRPLPFVPMPDADDRTAVGRDDVDRALAGSVPEERVQVLFVCTANQCRSPLAAAFLRTRLREVAPGVEV